MNNQDTNMKDNLYKYTFIDENNLEKEYEVLATFKSKGQNKIYYLMTDNTFGENNQLNTYAFYVNHKEDENEIVEDEKFYSVEDENELLILDKAFNKIKEEFQL